MARPRKTPNLRRRLEQWLHNTACEANTLSALLDVRMLDVAKAEDALVTGGGQSKFALARGVMFERGLLGDGATRLVTALVEKSVLPAEAQVVDFRPRDQGGPLASLEDGATQFAAQFDALVATGAPPALLLGPVLRLPAALNALDGVFIPDVVVVRQGQDGQTELVVGEIKAYHDRGGHTDAGKLAQARAQAGLYVSVLRALLRQHKRGAQVSVAHEGFLVMIRPGSSQPSVRAHEDLRWQARQAEANLARLREMASRSEVSAVRQGARKALAVVQQAPVRYRESCLGFCDRAAVCHQQACAQGDPAVLGDEVARQLGGLRLDRATQLLDGAAATTDAERDFIRRMEEASSCLRRVS